MPILLAVYSVTPRGLSNLVLLAASLVFYAWGEPIFVLLMLGSVGANYLFGLAISSSSVTPESKRIALFAAILTNLLILTNYKYFGFLAENLAELSGGAIDFRALAPERMPLGISFFTFQAMSYVIDLYRGVCPAVRNPLDLALYISLFPQLVAGPIVCYGDVAQELKDRRVTFTLFSAGVRRFIQGLGKKVLIANVLSVTADQVFDAAPDSLGASQAWCGLVCYALQIYYDFSGYSDMAVGLGLMFGFHFIENFNAPYSARSLTDFWRRWHISLSHWFRDYLYIPLGGNRGSAFRTYANLFTVFFFCGLWHGASWNFVLWGLFHGTFLVLERAGLGGVLERLPVLAGHVYMLFVVLLSWVLFRAPDVTSAWTFYKSLFFGGLRIDLAASPIGYANLLTRMVLVVAVACCVPWDVLSARLVVRSRALLETRIGRLLAASSNVGGACLYCAILITSLVGLTAATHNPFIYFRF
ncbi:MAG TPA: MBOAT family protein [Pirellulales bacterium]|nr:MBOAT family protein [Pirellulales bacterium]